jgi:hypothetical protein
MRKKFTHRCFVGISGCFAALVAVHVASAEPWGTNAPVCPLGRCAPARGTWGFYPTKWRPWPGAIYPGMEQPAPQPGANQIPPSEIELPTPANEAQLQTPNPSRETTAPSTGGGAGNGGLPGGLMNEPIPAKGPANNVPADALPSPKNAPGAMPIPEEPNFGPPSLSEPPAPSNRPSGSFRARPRLPVDESVAGVESKSKDVTTLKLPVVRPSATTDSPLLIAPENEPDLLVPSLSSRPLHSASSTSSTISIDRATGNPLRDQSRGDAVQTASLSELDSTPLADPAARLTISKGLTGAARENPLRR